MTEPFNLEITEWVASDLPDPRERETFAMLEIRAGQEQPLTEVYDSLAQTVRRHINVPLYPLARWFLVNWWSLRWEPERTDSTHDWLNSHSMAAVSGDTAWPGLTFASDGEFIHLALSAEAKPDVAGIRYLQNAFVDVPALQFESAVDAFLEKVRARVAARLPRERELAGLIEELHSERTDENAAARCRLQAVAGIDPGAADEAWFAAVQELEGMAGTGATSELLAATARLGAGVSAAREAVEAMRTADSTVDLRWVPTVGAVAGEIPWERGARAAAAVRTSLGVPSGPLTRERLSEILGTNLPLEAPRSAMRLQVGGGYRNGREGGRTSVAGQTERLESQRFFLARLIGAASMTSATEHVLAVTGARTALQNAERSFAQELLCPWRELREFLANRDLDGEAIFEAAAHFCVSERVVPTTLVNKRMLPRHLLDPE